MSEYRGGSDLLAILGAAAVGAVIGAGAALMLAPKAGAELRSELQDTAHDASEKIQKVTEQFLDQVKMTAEDVKQQTAEAGHHVREEVAEKIAPDDEKKSKS